METTQEEEVSGARLRDMVLGIGFKKKHRAERIALHNKFNDRFNQWVDNHKESGFELKLNTHNGIEVNVVGFEDGQWISNCSVNLADRGWSYGLNPINETFASKEEAVRAGILEASIYLLQQIQSKCAPDIVYVQSQQCVKVCMQRLFGTQTKQSLLF
jgi:hypothetical protein